MTTPTNPVSKTRNRLLAAAATLAIAGAAGFGAMTTGTAPVFAEAVTIPAPQMTGFADIVEKVSPAVVSVQVKGKMQPAADSDTSGSPFEGFEDLPDNSPLKRFFRDFRGQGGPGNKPMQRHGERHNDRPRPIAQGSGFFISGDGYLVTNNHVVDSGTAYTVVTNDGTEYDAKLIGSDSRTDLAVLKVDNAKKPLTYVNFADDSKIRVGDWVVAVGNPFGLGGTVTSGIVSARGRDIGAGPYDDFIQIDAPVNHGNSGGPDFNLNGEVIGINTAIFSPSGGSVGIAFAIPASTAKEVVDDLIHGGSVSRGWLGVQIQPVGKDIAESLGLSDAKGALVSEPQDGSPAQKVGIKAGDVITAVDGKPVASPRELARVIGNIQPDKEVELTLWRNGKAENVKLTLGKLPDEKKQASADDQNGDQQAEPSSLGELGLTVSPSDDGKGLVVTDVDQDSDAADRGLQAGDVITSVNAKPVKTASDVTSAMKEAAKAGRKAVLVQVTRDNGSRFVALPIQQG